MRTICFHGRRERDMRGDFLFAAQILGAAAIEASLSAQVRTPGWPSPPGAPDRALVRLSLSPPKDLDLPKRFDLEMVCDPSLAVIPPMGNALRPGGVIIFNAPEPPRAPAGGPSIFSLDLSALALRHAAPLCLALAGAVWASLGIQAPDWNLPLPALKKGACAVMPDSWGNLAWNLIREVHLRISAQAEPS